MKKSTVVILLIVALAFGFYGGYEKGAQEVYTDNSITETAIEDEESTEISASSERLDAVEDDGFWFFNKKPKTEKTEIKKETTPKETTPKEPEPRVFDEEFYPYYASLGEDEKIVYGELVTGIENGAESIDFSRCISRYAFSNICSYITYEQEQLFWFGGSCTYYTNIDNLVVKAVPIYNESMIGRLDEVKAEVDAEVQKILKKVEDKNDLDAEKYFHNYLCKTIKYEFGENDQNIYSAFVEKKTVCAGYTKALRRLLTERGIPCYYCRGSSIDQETGKPANHAWNIVKMKGNYYAVDVTWDDMYKEDGSMDLVKYQYFNIPDEIMNKDHTRDLTGGMLPLCDGGSCEFKKAYGYSWVDACAKFLKTSVKTPISKWAEYSEACSDPFIKKGLGTRKITFIGRGKTLINKIDSQKKDGTYKDYMNRIIKYHKMNGWDFSYQYSYNWINENVIYCTQEITMKNY